MLSHCSKNADETEYTWLNKCTSFGLKAEYTAKGFL